MIKTIKQILGMHSKPQKYVLPLASCYPEWHSKAGSETHVVYKIQPSEDAFFGDRQKIHAVLGNYSFWQRVSAEVDAGKARVEACLLLPQSGFTNRLPLFRLGQLSVQRLEFQPGNLSDVLVDTVHVPIEQFSRNEGLAADDLYEWYAGYQQSELCIVHFTDFRY